MDSDPQPTDTTQSTASAPVTLTAIPAGGGAPEPLVLQPDETGAYHVSLECLPGANAIHLEVAIGGQLRLRAEVRAQAGEVVRVGLCPDPAGELALQAGSHQALFLPLEPAYGPLPPIPPPRGETAWDICLVIDATTRTSAGAYRQNQTGLGHPPPTRENDSGRPTGPDDGFPTLDSFLLNQPDQWAAVVDPIVALVGQLEQWGQQREPGQGCRLAIIAFGDESPPPGIYAADLVPAFRLHSLPDNRSEHLLIPMSPETLTEVLRTQLRSTPGGDFVDALADALAAANRLQWGDRRRHLLILIGDSPGHATAHPVPYGGDALPRHADVDVEAARLHRDHRVEILTLYHPLSAALAKSLLDSQRALVNHARDQYRRLAADPRLAFTTANFAPEQAAAALLERQGPLARGTGWGRLHP